MAREYLIVSGDTVVFPVELTVAKSLYLTLERLAGDNGVTVAELIADACEIAYGDGKGHLKKRTVIRREDISLNDIDLYPYDESVGC